MKNKRGFRKALAKQGFIWYNSFIADLLLFLLQKGNSL